MLEGKLVLCVLAVVWSCSCEDELPGHMQPLGSHMDPLPITVIDYMPSPKQFYEQFVKPKTPVLFQGLMSGQDVIANWQDDQYLRRRFGDMIVTVETRKKENRSERSSSVRTFKDFLDTYEDENIYLISEISEEMTREWMIPKFLLCGGFTDNFMFGYLWFSSGGTKSVLHTDSDENLHCLISGRKRVVLIDPRYSEEIGPEHAEQGYYNVDVERVDMREYPRLASVPWYLATVNPGDCLFIPVKWIHNINSVGRNMGYNIWFRSFEFDEDDCPSDLSQLPNFQSLGKTGFHPELEMEMLLEMVKREDGSIHAEDIFQLLHVDFGMHFLEKEHIEKIMQLLQPGCDGVIHSDKKISKESVKAVYDYIGGQSPVEELPQPDDYYDPNAEFGGMRQEDFDMDDYWEGPIREPTRNQKHRNEL